MYTMTNATLMWNGKPCTHNDCTRYPRPLGPAASTSTYLHQHPLAEPYVDEEAGHCVLRDNGQDLTETIGKYTVRLHAFAGADDAIACQHNLMASTSRPSAASGSRRSPRPTRTWTSGCRA